MIDTFLASPIVSSIFDHFPDAKVLPVSEISPAEAKILTRLAVDSLACANCRREALRGLAYWRAPICADCAPYAGAFYMMTTEQETESLQAGGAAGGEYLESIDKTDLAALSEIEWATFLEKVLDGYSESMREAAKTTPPF